MKKYLVVTLLFAFTGCGGDSTDKTGSTGPTGPMADITGPWQFSDNITSATAKVVCSSTGRVTFTQTGEDFIATATLRQFCTDSVNNSSVADVVVPVTGGRLDGTTVSFKTNRCQYNGTLSGILDNAMSGTASCTFVSLGPSNILTGTWQAVG
jgi:hypothetical protein